jgi:hypothetical protein
LYERRPEWVYALSAGLILISIAISAWKVAGHPGVEAAGDQRLAIGDQGLEISDKGPVASD